MFFSSFSNLFFDEWAIIYLGITRNLETDRMEGSALKRLLCLAQDGEQHATRLGRNEGFLRSRPRPGHHRVASRTGTLPMCSGRPADPQRTHSRVDTNYCVTFGQILYH